MMVTYYVTLFVSLLFNYMTHHLFCLCGIYVTTYVTPTMTSLIARRLLLEGIMRTHMHAVLPPRVHTCLHSVVVQYMERKLWT